jgi:hypothetical protein
VAEPLPDPQVVTASTEAPRARAGAALRADCSRCAGLCCVGPAFARSADFALDKPAGVACPHLAAAPGEFGCTIHDELRPRGFAGCTTYDCFGAGQHVVQDVYAGATWRDAGVDPGEVFAVFAVVRPLHELLWLLTEALALEAAAPLHGRLQDAVGDSDRLTRLPAADLARLDVDGHRAAVVPLLREASALARAGTPARDLSGADLTGADLSGGRPGRSLRGASLRGAVLLAADLRGADLRLADLTGADLRAADVRGTDLSQVLFLSRQQAHSARGDHATALPSGLDRPSHWARRA